MKLFNWWECTDAKACGSHGNECDVFHFSTWCIGVGQYFAQSAGIHSPAFYACSFCFNGDGCAFVAPGVVVLGPWAELDFHVVQIAVQCVVPWAVGIDFVGWPLAGVGCFLPMAVADGRCAAVFLLVAFGYFQAHGEWSVVDGDAVLVECPCAFSKTHGEMEADLVAVLPLAVDAKQAAIGFAVYGFAVYGDVCAFCPCWYAEIEWEGGCCFLLESGYAYFDIFAEGVLCLFVDGDFLSVGYFDACGAVTVDE